MKRDTWLYRKRIMRHCHRATQVGAPSAGLCLYKCLLLEGFYTRMYPNTGIVNNNTSH